MNIKNLSSFFFYFFWIASVPDILLLVQVLTSKEHNKILIEFFFSFVAHSRVQTP
jgi:hypothetical protein